MNKTNNNLLIYQKYLELIYYTNDLLKKYPKSETFALVKEIKSTMYYSHKFQVFCLNIRKYQPLLKLRFYQVRKSLPLHSKEDRLH